jgi:hypothetical protein
VSIDEAAKYVYRRADSATLLGLLPELRRLGQAAQKEHERIEREHPDDIDGNEKFTADLAAYVTMTTERDLWIRNELKRRGLLPLWPGGEDHLLDDA